MAKTQHTPGPWKLERGTYVHTGTWVITAGRMSTSSPLTKIPDYDDAAEADGHLIAAAPELLAVVQRFVALGAVTPALLADAHAAIAKAEGRSAQ